MSKLKRSQIVVAIGGAVGVLLGWRLWQLKDEFWPSNALGQAMHVGQDVPSQDSFDLTHLTIDRAMIISGGPAKDGIPALTGPRKQPLAEAPLLPGDRLVVVEIGSQRCAYPISILNWHEIINDVVGGVPIAVTYCPLCDSVSVLDRRLDGTTREFGVSGLLMNSNVLMYDRTDNALWSQVGLTAISGPHAGKSLEHLPWRLALASQLRIEQPDIPVVDRATGFARDYASNPYRDYFDSAELMFPVPHRDERLPVKVPVIGVQLGGIARAYPVASIAKSPKGRLVDTIGGGELVLEADQCGNTRVISAPPESITVHTLWFAWAAFHQRTELYEPKPSTNETPDGSNESYK